MTAATDADKLIAEALDLEWKRHNRVIGLLTKESDRLCNAAPELARRLQTANAALTTALARVAKLSAEAGDLRVVNNALAEQLAEADAALLENGIVNTTDGREIWTRCNVCEEGSYDGEGKIEHIPTCALAAARARTAALTEGQPT